MQEWFDIEIPEAIKLERNISKSPKTQNLQIDYSFCIETKYNTQKLTKQKKTEFLI